MPQQQLDLKDFAKSAKEVPQPAKATPSTPTQPAQLDLTDFASNAKEISTIFGTQTFTPDTLRADAARFGLTVKGKRTPSQNRAAGGSPTSWHLTDNAIDAQGSPAARRKFAEFVRDTYGANVAELFYEDISIKNGQQGKVRTDHNDHVHVAWRPIATPIEGVSGVGQANLARTVSQDGKLTQAVQAASINRPTQGENKVLTVKKLTPKSQAAQPTSHSKPANIVALDPNELTIGGYSAPVPKVIEKSAQELKAKPKALTKTEEEKSLKKGWNSVATARYKQYVKDLVSDPAYIQSLEDLPTQEAKYAKALEISKERPLDEKEQIALGVKGWAGIQDLGTLLRGAGKAIGSRVQGGAKLIGAEDSLIAKAGKKLSEISTERQNLYGRRGALGDIEEAAGHIVPDIAARLNPIGMGVSTALGAYGEGATVEESIAAGAKTAAMVKLGGALVSKVPAMESLPKMLQPVARFGGRVAANTAAPLAIDVGTGTPVNKDTLTHAIAFGVLFSTLPHPVKEKARQSPVEGELTRPAEEVAAQLEHRVQSGEPITYEGLSRDEQILISRQVQPTSEQHEALKQLGYNRKDRRAMSQEEAQGVIEGQVAKSEYKAAKVAETEAPKPEEFAKGATEVTQGTEVIEPIAPNTPNTAPVNPVEFAKEAKDSTSAEPIQLEEGFRQQPYELFEPSTTTVPKYLDQAISQDEASAALFNSVANAAKSGELEQYTRGRVNQQDALAEGRSMDFSQEDLTKLAETFKGNQQQIIAAEAYMRKVQEDALAKAKRAADSGLETDIIAWRQAEAQSDFVTNTFFGIRAEAGRALRTYRDFTYGVDPKAKAEYVKSARDLLTRKLAADKAEGTTLAPKVDESPADFTKHEEHIAQLEAKIAELEAKQAMKSLQREASRTKRSSTKEELSKEWGDLTAEFNEWARKSLSGTRSTFDAEGAKIVVKMAVNAIKRGAVTLEEVVSSIHARVKDYMDGVTESDIRRALSGYGIEAEASKPNQVQAQLAELKKQAYLIESISDVKSNTSLPNDKKLVKKPTSETTANLEQQLNLELRAKGLQPKPKVSILSKKELLAKKKTQTRAEIDRLDRERVAGKQAKLPPQDVTPDAELLALQAERDTLKRSMQDPLAANKEQVKRRIQELEAKIQGKETKVEAEFPKHIYTDSELEGLKVQAANLSKQLREQAKAKGVSYEEQLAKFKESTKKSIANLEEQLKTGQFNETSKLALDPEADLLKKQLSKLRQDVNKAKAAKGFTDTENKIFTRSDALAILDRVKSRDVSDPKNELYSAHDLLTIGGYFYEGGIDTKSNWKKQMKHSIPSITEQQLNTIWKGLAPEINRRVSAADSRESLLKSTTKLLGKEKAKEFFAAIADIDPNDPQATLKYNIAFKQHYPYTWMDKWAARQKRNALSAISGAILDGVSTQAWQAIRLPLNAMEAALQNAIERSQGATTLSRKPIKETLATAYGFNKEIGAAFKTFFNSFLHGMNPEVANRFDYNIHHDLGGVKNPLNWLSRIRQALNDAQNTSAESQSRWTEAARQGKTWAETKQLAENPALLSDKSRAKILEQEKFLTFTDDADKLLNAAYGIRALSPKKAGLNIGKAGEIRPLEFLKPFMRTRYNLMKRGLEMSPFGYLQLLSPEVRKSPELRAQALTRATASLPVIAGLTYYALQGNITGAAPDYETQRDEWQKWREKKIKPYSINIDGYWFPYKDIPGMSTMFAIAAGIADAKRLSNSYPTDEVITKAAIRFGNQVTDGLPLRELVGLGAERGYLANIEFQAGNALSSTFIPMSASAREWANFSDEWDRQTEGVYQQMLEGLPVLRQKMLKKNKQQRNPRSGVKALIPFYPAEGAKVKLD